MIFSYPERSICVFKQQSTCEERNTIITLNNDNSRTANIFVKLSAITSSQSCRATSEKNYCVKAVQSLRRASSVRSSSYLQCSPIHQQQLDFFIQSKMGFGKKQKPTKASAAVPQLDYSTQAMASCIIFDSEAISLPKMSLSVPYHPYKCCLICGRSESREANKRPSERDQEGREWEVEWWPIEEQKSQSRKLQRCSGCKQALYCSHNCQRHDWNVSHSTFVVVVCVLPLLLSAMASAAASKEGSRVWQRVAK